MNNIANVIKRLVVYAALFPGLLALSHNSSALFGFGEDASEAEGRSVWQSGEQYVRIVPAGESGNEHPHNIDPALLVHALQQVTVKEERRLLYYGQYEPIPLWPQQLASTLARALHKGLADAAAGEDVVFLVHGTYKTLSVLREVRGTTGRVFYRDGRLNIIFGEILRSDQQSGQFNSDLRGLDYETKRSVKYKGARRDGSVDSGWLAVPVDGISLHADRSDWIELDIDVLAASRPVPEEQAAPRTAADAVERRQMLLDMARMRKDIDSLRSGADSGSSDATMDVQRRLHTLKALRDNELITVEEYEAKRRKIIDEL